MHPNSWEGSRARLSGVVSLRTIAPRPSKQAATCSISRSRREAKGTSMGNDWICRGVGPRQAGGRRLQGAASHTCYVPERQGAACRQRSGSHPGPPATSWESIRITLPATTLSMWRHSRCARNPGSKGKVCRELKGYHSAGRGRGWPGGLWRLLHSRGCTDQNEHTLVCPRAHRSAARR